MATPEFILRRRERIGPDPPWLIRGTASVAGGEGRGQCKIFAE